MCKRIQNIKINVIMVLNYDVKMIKQVLPFCIYMGQDMMKGTLYGCDNQNQAIVTCAKYYMFRAFPENLK